MLQEVNFTSNTPPVSSLSLDFDIYMDQYVNYKSEFNIKWIILKNKWKKVILYAGKMWRLHLSIDSEAETLMEKNTFELYVLVWVNLPENLNVTC